MSQYITESEITHHTFFRLVHCDVETQLDLEYISTHFPLDVDIEYIKNESKNELKNIKNDVDIPVLYQYNKVKNKKYIIDKSLPICTTRARNRILRNEYNPTGFIKIIYPNNNYSLSYSRPPEFINIGVYCVYCKQYGPMMHNNNCSCPEKNSLFFTFEGLIKNIFNIIDNQQCVNLLHTIEEITEINYTDIMNKNFPDDRSVISFNSIKSKKSSLRTIDEDNMSMASSIKKYKEFKINDTTMYKKIYERFYEKFPNDFNIIFGEYYQSNDPIEYMNLFTNIKLINVIQMYKKESKGYFYGPLSFTYASEDGKYCTIRLFDNGMIFFISNPCIVENLYLSFIDKVNKLFDNKVLKIRSVEIRSLFSSLNIINYNLIKNDDEYLETDNLEYNQFDIKHLDIEKLFNYLYPSSKSSPMIVRNNEYFIKYNTSYDTICFKYHAILENKRIYIQFYNSNYNFTSGPYKITVQIFSQGHVQFNFCHCDEKDPVNYTYNDIVSKNKNFVTTFDNINYEFNNIKKLLLHYINLFIKMDSSILIDAPLKKISNKIYNTISGILPYAKRKKFNVGDKVNLFNDTYMKWSKSIGIVTEIIKHKKLNNEYIVQLKNMNLKVKYKNLRRSDSNNDQVCRIKENGVYKVPIPYSFYGKCSGGLTQYINPLGICSRSDNRYYPTCSEVDEDWIINFLLHSFTKEEMDIYNIDIESIEKNEYDKYTGTFQHNCVKIGSIIKAYINGTYINVKIIDKYKTHGLGNDENKVIYKVIPIDYSDNIIEITGEQFHKMYIENRYFKGIMNFGLSEDLIKKYLIDCFRHYQLSYNTNYIYPSLELSSNKVFNKLLNKITNYKLNFQYLNNKNIINLLKYNYTCYIIPNDSILTFIFNYEKGIYHFNNGNITLLSSTSSMNENMIIPGYLYKNKFYALNHSNDLYNMFPSFVVSPSLYSSNKFLIQFIKNKFTENCSIHFINHEKQKYYKWTSDIQKIICVQAIKEYHNNWTLGIFKPSYDPNLNTKEPKETKETRDNTKDIKEEEIIDNEPMRNPDDLIVDNNDNEYYKLFDNVNINYIPNINPGTYLNIKVNVMLNGIIHPYVKVVNIEKVPQQMFKGYTETKKIINTILYPINTNIFISGLWILGNFKTTILENNEGLLVAR